jgi:hydrogenase expression/formation protein HypC
MCLAIPGEIIKIIDETNAVVAFMGLEKAVITELVENIKVGDYVIVHAGYAIHKLDRDEALKTLALIEEVNANIG